MIGNWIKKKLKNWLLDGEGVERQPAAMSNQIQAQVPGKPPRIETFIVTGATGFLLAGQSLVGQGVRLIAREQCLDGDQWLTLWKKHTPGWREWRWADGRPMFEEDQSR